MMRRGFIRERTVRAALSVCLKPIPEQIMRVFFVSHGPDQDGNENPLKFLSRRARARRAPSWGRAVRIRKSKFNGVSYASDKEGRHSSPQPHSLQGMSTSLTGSVSIVLEPPDSFFECCFYRGLRER